MNATQPLTNVTKYGVEIIEKYPDKEWTPTRMSLLDIFGRFISYSYKLIEEDKWESPPERRNWRYQSLKQLKKYNKSICDLLNDEHRKQIQSLETNMKSIIDYEELFEKLVFMY